MEASKFHGIEAVMVCERCKGKYTRPMCQVVNSAEMPEATGAILRGTFFDFHCPHCNKEEDTFFPMIYLDPVNKYLFYLQGEDENENKLFRLLLEDQLKTLGDIGPMSDYRIRVVHLPADLSEKIRLSMLGLDDRVIELCKLPIVHSFHEQFPEKELYRVALIIGGPGMEFLICPKGSKTLYHADFSRELYDHIAEQLSAFFPPDRGQKICIDHAWALQLFQPRGVQQ